MKRVRLCLAVACLALGGCFRDSATDDSEAQMLGDDMKTPTPCTRNKKQVVSYAVSDGLSVIRDHETGCEYIQVRNKNVTGLSPRLDQNGRQICRPSK